MRITGCFWTICWQLLEAGGVCFMGTWSWRALFGQRVKSLPVMGNHVWKSWSSPLWRWLGAQKPPGMFLQEIFWLLCQCWHLTPRFAPAMSWLTLPWTLLGAGGSAGRCVVTAGFGVSLQDGMWPLPAPASAPQQCWGSCLWHRQFTQQNFRNI